MGDTVNVAQRLEQLGKRYGGGEQVVIVVSRAALERAGMLDRARPLGPQSLRGRPGALDVYALS